MTSKDEPDSSSMGTPGTLDQARPVPAQDRSGTEPVSVRFVAAYVRLVRLFVLSSLMVFGALSIAYGREGMMAAIAVVSYVIVVGLVFGLVNARAPRLIDRLEALGRRQAHYFDELDDRWVAIAIVVAAASSLYFELVVIRWLAGLFPFFAFYKNFALLACFAGLGTGYALARERALLLVVVLPLLAYATVALLALRYANTGVPTNLLFVMPFAEQLHLGPQIPTDTGVPWISRLAALVLTCAFLAIVLLGTILVFLPVGQLCGRLMERRVKLRAYGLNLLGSVLGVAAVMALSYFWTGPIVWFGVLAVCLALYQQFDRTHSVTAFVATGTLLVALAWPTAPTHQQIYSPYQLIERTANEITGLSELLTGGKYYMRVFDFSSDCSPDETTLLCRVKAHYDLPYRLNAGPGRVAVVGAGTGNDVAAALRHDARRVWAIEIDPVILRLGGADHPERPYGDPRVTAVVQDARAFFRNTDETFDVIVYGVLDSHTLLSQASSVRLDSFVYTVEGIRDSYARLVDGGVLSISFALVREMMGQRLFAMMREASGGIEPIALQTGYDANLTTAFILRKGGVRDGDKRTLGGTGFRNVTEDYAGASMSVDLATDDWPFFYMKGREYPLSYLPVLLTILLVSIYAVLKLIPHESLSPRYLSFLFLGAGFMLVETKAITELGLAFGNTWHVIGIAIIAILVMAFLANAMVARLRPTRVGWVYGGLFATILIGFASAGANPGLGESAYKIVTVLLLASPMLFSGIAFSTQLSTLRGTVSGTMAYNLIGAMLGGLLEYNSMYFGFSFLYLIALALYALAFASARFARA